jgi:hypothetical protein
LRVAAPEPIRLASGSGTANVIVELAIRPIRLARLSCHSYNWACSGLAAVRTIASHVGTLEGCLTDNLKWYHDFRRIEVMSTFLCLVRENALSLLDSISLSSWFEGREGGDRQLVKGKKREGKEKIY